MIMLTRRGKEEEEKRRWLKDEDYACDKTKYGGSGSGVGGSCSNGMVGKNGMIIMVWLYDTDTGVGDASDNDNGKEGDENIIYDDVGSHDDDDDDDDNDDDDDDDDGYNNVVRSRLFNTTRRHLSKGDAVHNNQDRERSNLEAEAGGWKVKPFLS